MELFIIYLLLTLPKVGGLFIALAILSGLVTLIAFAATIDDIADKTDLGQRAIKFTKRTLCVCVISAIIAELTPTKEDAIILAASAGIITIMKSEPAQQLGDKTLQLLNKKLDEALAEP